MTSKGRAGIVLVVAALGAAGAGAVVLREHHEDALRTEEAPVADASVDAHAKTTKGKPAKKKKGGRGGKTRIAGRAGGGGAGGGGGGGSRGAHGDHGGRGPASRGGAHEHPAGPTGPSYESALDSNNQHVTMGANDPPDLTDAQLSAPMSDGTFVSECGAPDSMGVTVKVAIKMGRAVGVSVSTNPASADVASCIDHHIRELSWPASPKMDSLVTTY